MNELILEKKAFRKMALEKRNELSQLEIDNKSKLVYEKLNQLKSFNEAKTIMIYLSFKNEVKTDEIIKHLFKLNKKVVVPISIKGTRTLLLSEISNLEADVELDFYNIRIPKKDKIIEVKPEEIDFVITPGVAFSKDRYRMGYGGGYYDTFIEKLRTETVTCALAFEVQIYDNIPKEPHDKQINYIITESKLLQND